jgi:hypothetical protein
MSRCGRGTSLAELVDYWLGDISPSAMNAIEEHLFACATCSHRLSELAALGDGIRALARHGRLHAVLTPEFVETLKARGAKIREYRMQPGGSVNCSIAPDDDLAVAHLEAPLEGVSRLDLVFEFAQGGLPQQRFEDVVFSPDKGEIVLAPRAEELRQLSNTVQRVRLLSVSAAGDRLLGEYLFRHSPYEIK